VGGVRRLPVETMAMADQAPQATLNGVGKLQKNGSTVWYVAEVKGPTLRNSGSGIPNPEFRSKLILPLPWLIPTCVPPETRKFRGISGIPENEARQEPE
jgi:hypothetical protein